MPTILFPDAGFGPPVQSGTDKSARLAFKLRTTMYQAMPPRVEDRLTFHFDEVAGWSLPGAVVDGDDVPFSPIARHTGVTTGREPVNTGVYYGLQFMDQRRSHPTQMGEVSVSELVVTMLDEDYQQIKGCTRVTAAADTYMLKRREPPVQVPGYTVLVQVLRFEAVKETAL